MLFTPELKPKSSKKEKELSPETMAILIQAELIKRSGKEPEKWIAENADYFRKVFDHKDNKQMFLNLMEENSEELYALLEMVLSTKN